MLPKCPTTKLGSARLPCPHRAGPHHLEAAKYAKAIQDNHGDETWVSHVYSLRPPPAEGATADEASAKRPAFVISWKYSGAAFVALGTIDDEVFELDLPLVSMRLIHLLATSCEEFPARLRLWSWGLKWITTRVALLMTEPTALRLRPAALRARPAAPAPDAPPPGPPPGAAGDAPPFVGPPIEEGDAAVNLEAAPPPGPAPAARADEPDELAVALGMYIPDEAAEADVDAWDQDEPSPAEPQIAELDENGVVQASDGDEASVVEEAEAKFAVDDEGDDGDDVAPHAHGLHHPASLADLDLDGLRAVHASSIASVQECIRRVAERQEHPRERNGVALLVTEDSDVKYVHWTNVALARGRPIDFNYMPNGSMNFKATPAFAVPEVSYAGATIVMNSTGLRLTRGKKDVQPILEGWQLLAYNLQLAKLFGGPLAPIPLHQCVPCEYAATVGADGYIKSTEGRDKTFFWCQGCCASWHTCCIENFGGAAASSFTCPLCS